MRVSDIPVGRPGSASRRECLRSQQQEGGARTASSPPKYRHPESGRTWSVRRRAPLWLAAEHANAGRAQFLI
ncbi:H-NS histone family protein [Achromobacter mucicolens]|nr:H-NS family nucleoid-associated regulatory protein [Achromobacter animicus]MDH0684781.1 H-NS histone family protein [Achromobacter animicus]